MPFCFTVKLVIIRFLANTLIQKCRSYFQEQFSELHMSAGEFEDNKEMDYKV